VENMMNRKLKIGALAAALCLLFAAPTRAYEEDTHFTMTLVLCRAVGLTDAEALTVASYDQGMDDSPGTVANGGPLGGIIPNIPEESFWHSIPKNGTVNEVLGRKQELWNRVVAETDPNKRLQRLGVFFHYQQDTWAHRKHQNSHPTLFDPFQVPIGHALFGHQPDRPPYDPVCALRCLEDGVSYAKQFMTQCLRRTPNALFNNYSAASGTQDANWSDGRKGAFFNTLTIDNSTPARKFLTDLIRSQVDAYKSSLDANPNFAGRYTADEANYAEMRTKLEAACSRAGQGISIPASRTKITTLTTAQLQGENLGTRNYTVKIYTGDKLGAGTDSNIFLTIIGASGQLTEQRLNGLISGNAFERNQTDSLTLRDLASIGELRGVTVRSDNSYPGSAWFLGWIEISSPGIATRRFDFNAWVESPNLIRTMRL
jgi:hypothetical protein